jgi:hypothetical protein
VNCRPCNGCCSAAGDTPVAEILQGNSAARLELVSQGIGNQSIEEIYRRWITCRHGVSKVEAAYEKPAPPDSSFKQVGIPRATLRQVDCSNQRFADGGSFIETNQLASLDKIVELKITPAFRGHGLHRRMTGVEDRADVAGTVAGVPAGGAIVFG